MAANWQATALLIAARPPPPEEGAAAALAWLSVSSDMLPEEPPADTETVIAWLNLACMGVASPGPVLDPRKLWDQVRCLVARRRHTALTDFASRYDEGVLEAALDAFPANRAPLIRLMIERRGAYFENVPRACLSAPDRAARAARLRAAFDLLDAEVLAKALGHGAWRDAHEAVRATGLTVPLYSCLYSTFAPRGGDEEDEALRVADLMTLLDTPLTLENPMMKLFADKDTPVPVALTRYLRDAAVEEVRQRRGRLPHRFLTVWIRRLNWLHFEDKDAPEDILRRLVRAAQHLEPSEDVLDAFVLLRPKPENAVAASVAARRCAEAQARVRELEARLLGFGEAASQYAATERRMQTRVEELEQRLRLSKRRVDRLAADAEPSVTTRSMSRNASRGAS